MELGEKLRLARLEAGLSQRALCGDEITRNMLSRIENGAARPSMKTLGCLAARLGKPVSYFLEEDTVCSPNQEIMTAVRQLFDGKDYAGAMRALAQYRAPDEIYDRERQLLEILVRLSLAEDAGSSSLAGSWGASWDAGASGVESGSTSPKKPSEMGGSHTLWNFWKPSPLWGRMRPITPKTWSSADVCSLAAFRGRSLICPVWMKR